MEIKSVGFNRIILVIIVILFLTLLINNALAEEERAEVSILGEPTYILTNEVIKNNIAGRSYQINVTLYNAGDLRSKELVVNLSDEEGYSLKNYIFIDADETKIVSFNWSTLIDRNQQLIIQFYPSDLDATWTQYNSGSRSFTIQIDSNDGSSDKGIPGFELTFIIIAIVILAFFMKKKK